MCFSPSALGRWLLAYIGTLKTSGFDLAKTLAKTLQDPSEAIARMPRFSGNNGISEGFHRRMKLIQCQAYGFSDLTSTTSASPPKAAS